MSSLYDSSQVTSIRIRPLIRYLGLLLGVVVGLPSWIGWVWFLLNPAEMVKNWDGLAFAVVIGGIALFATRGWVRIGGKSTERLIRLRGWWKTVSVAPQDLARIQKVVSMGSNSQGFNRREYNYHLEDHRGEPLGVIPGSLEICPGWDKFLQHLHNVAAASRRGRPHDTEPAPGLADKPVEEWTSKDFEDYESLD
ncbi:hypothetical protein [Lignipirellula cremea]|uniref:Uncharacterized protein n=1 Tax=Lignipirellula cremea TaxID=2528010 RepID=A0A518DQB3_9BACT|nr:hypothetical protein [Lignipirellula cremea]QDU94026.1 hypothetical protein Pla8534_18120 [Lignipirellula cremea]